MQFTGRKWRMVLASCRYRAHLSTRLDKSVAILAHFVDILRKHFTIDYYSIRFIDMYGTINARTSDGMELERLRKGWGAVFRHPAQMRINRSKETTPANTSFYIFL